MAFTGYWGSMFGHAPIGLLVGFGIGGAFVAQLAPSRMFVYNPEWTGYVTQDIFRGTMIPYGPGFHFSHWWEERNKQGNYSLKVITRDFRADVATQTAKVEISGKYEYAIDLALIVRAIGVDETTIESGITAFIESFLTSQCAGENADDVRKSIDKLNDNLADEFMCLQEQHENFECEEENKELASFGNKYGFITVSVVIDNIKLPEAAQKTRDAIDEAVALHSVVAAMYGISSEELKNMLASKTISVKDYNTMLNRALAASDNAKMNLNVIEADIPALIGKLADQFTKGGRS
ncbi:MAG: hypothetical protein WC798_01305 [Candidatus Paceibacterota bacterium]|jgi:hypothetical protein